MDRRTFLQRNGLAALGTGLAASGAATATVHKAQHVRSLTMVTSWPRGFPGMGTSAERVTRRIEAATNGEISITMSAAGERVGPFDVFDAVSNGKADLYHSADYYQQHRTPAYNFFTALPFGMTAIEMASWLLWGGGQALWDELASPANIKPLMCTATGAQMGGWFNRQVLRPEDFDGLKIRMPGLGGTVLARLGATPVNVAGGEILDALKSGRIDAAEWVGPWNDLAAGLQQVAKYYYYPGFHEPGGCLTLGFNKDVWQSLAEWHQAAIVEVATAEYLRSLAEFNFRNAKAIAELASIGIRPTMFSAEVLSAIGRLSREVVGELSRSDGLTARILASYEDSLASSMQWASTGEDAFVAARRSVYAM